MQWNIKLTVFKLAIHFKHKMIRICQRFYKKVVLSEIRFNRVQIKRARPVHKLQMKKKKDQLKW